MGNKIIPSQDKNWIMKLSLNKKESLMNGMLAQNNVGIFIEFAKIITSESKSRGGVSKEDVNKIYSKYYPGEILDL